MKRKKITIRDAKKVDEAIMQLAVYEATKGMVVDFFDSETMSKIQNDIVKIFNYFKMFIKSGEYELSELEDHVCRKNSAIYEPKLDINDLKDKDVINKDYSFDKNFILPENIIIDESLCINDFDKRIDIEFGGNIKPFSNLKNINNDILGEDEFSDMSENSLDDLNKIIDDFSKDKNNDKKSFFYYFLEQLINKKKDENEDDDDQDGITSRK